MPYFGINSERYGGWTKEEKEETLENAELPPDREPRTEECGAAKRLEPMDGPETDAIKLIEAGEDDE